MTKNNKLKVWESRAYYKLSEHGSSTYHPGMEILAVYAKSAVSILDLGCGEGTRLAYLAQKRTTWAHGVDISQTAVRIAKNKYRPFSFQVADIENLDLVRKYDLVYSAFVLEHAENPEKIIDRAINHVGKKGVVSFLAPNFGAPNRRSPNSIENKRAKIINGFRNDFMYKEEGLGWKKVLPKKGRYKNPDDDARCEPYLLSLVRYIEKRGLSVEYKSSLWELESWSLNLRKTCFMLLGKLGLFPFNYWGPQLFVVARRVT